MLRCGNFMSWPRLKMFTYSSTITIILPGKQYSIKPTCHHQAGSIPCQKIFTLIGIVTVERLSHPQLLLSRMVFQSGVLIYLEPTPEQTFMLLATQHGCETSTRLFLSKSLGVFLYPKNRQRAPVQSENTVQFLPESGNALVNKASVVAFKSVNWLGLPQSIDGEIKDKTGSVVTEFHSDHDGMGKFYYMCPCQEKVI